MSEIVMTGLAMMVAVVLLAGLLGRLLDLDDLSAIADRPDSPRRR